MKKLFLISVAICIILTSCSGQNYIPTAISSYTPKPTVTATAIATPKETPQPILAPTSTFTPEPTVIATAIPTKTSRPTLTPTSTFTPLPSYQNKKVLFDYYVIGSHSIYDWFFVDVRSYPKLVLYDDGQMIIPGEKYEQKVLSPDEIKQFLSKLEALGFYSLESNQMHDPTDKLYDYGNNYQIINDGFRYCVAVNTDKPRNLCVYEPGIQYLIPEMKNILKYLDEYEPTGITPYYPDRILLWIQSGRDPYYDNLPKTAIAWDEKFPRLENSITYVDGDLAKEIYSLYESTNQGNVFTQDGKEYTVFIEIVLPHEKLTNANH